MFGRRVTLFKLFGFEVRLDASWIVIAALVTWSLATAVFPAEYHGLAAASYWWMGIAGAVGLFASIVLHELSHSLVANHYDLPMRGITLFIFGGVAEMSSEPANPKVEFRMAIAGPIASVVLGCLFRAAAFAVSGGPAQIVGVLMYLASINWLLAAFNLLPAFPLDGGRVLRAALWHFKGDLTRATEIASRIGSAFGFLLMAYAVFELFIGNPIGAVWYFLIGMFLRGAAQTSYQQVVMKAELEGEPVLRFMKPNPVTVRPELSIRHLVEDYIYRYDLRIYPVVGDSNELIGCVSPEDVGDMPKEEWDRHSVGEVTKPCSESNTVGPNTDALQALTKIQANGSSGLLVTERNRLLAVISPKDILNFMATKMKLEGHSMGPLTAPR